MLPVATRRAVRGKVGSLIRSNRGAVGTILGLQGITTVAGLVGPRVLGNIVNEVHTHSSVSPVDLAVAVFASALVAGTLFTALTGRRAARMGEKVIAELREDFVDSVLSLPLGTVEQAGTGDLLTRASADVDQLSHSVRWAAPQVAVALVQAVLTAAALIWTAPILGVTLVPAIPLLAIGTKWYMNRAPEAYLAERAGLAKVNGTIQETVTAGRTVEAFRLEDARNDQTLRDIDNWIRAERRTLYLRCRFFPASEMGYVIPLVLTILIGGLLHISGHLSVGSVTAAAVYAQLLIDPVDTILSWLDEFQLGSAAFARLLGVSEVPPEEETPDRPVDETVVADRLHYSYREGVDVLHGVDLALAPGDRVAVVGPSGAGKSTIALLLAGIHSPRSGSVEVGGVDAHRLPPVVLREEIALVTQEHHLFAGTLRDNLELVAPGAEDAVLEGALETVDASWWRDLPSGLDTELGPGGATLSAAQAQQ
ncbi:MAG TPA: ABC transporter ATP-binding protein, partial [Acidimicrobiales bacterium]|nr:ABC transporter ATP-binding protein [Acidimicrobiales bacterium]